MVTRLLVEPGLAPDPTTVHGTGVLGLVVVIAIVSLAFGAVFIGSGLALRIAELRSIVGIMVDALRRPRPA